ncbi:MAG: HD domain-containing protein [Candidatus Doudnabacteria bacterium]|nr:HD domain-containing protein [Candidatus Doudnabacteria bacterium]
MKHLLNLFKLAELTRAQTQYGYLLSGIPRHQISNLAEHHYLVTFIGWQLAANLKQAGAKINVQQVLEFCLIHDLGELMGGDISALYAKVNPKAKKLAVAFEEENQSYLASFFGQSEKYFRGLAKEIMDAKSDEALIAKIADYIEAANFKAYVGYFRESDKKFNHEKLSGFANKIQDKTAKKLLKQFITDWLKTAAENDYMKILRKNG